jgi:type IV secretory pathway VirD2 relaxase
MSKSEKEREFRLRPGKPKVAQRKGESIAWASAYRILMHYARQSRAGNRGTSGGLRRFSYRQRCAVRITYSKNTVRGQWRAHGRYLERESAGGAEAGFDAHMTGVGISTRLREWQVSKEELLWKLIISPEFGDRVDLERLTRDLMLRIEEDLGGPVEWVAVVHRNTQYPHAHVALRGVMAEGRTLRLSRDYVKRGVREIAEEMCTRQIGFRTTLDAADAERREISEMRFTSLDRAIIRNARNSESGLIVANVPEHHLLARLITLWRMGVAENTGTGTWRIRPDMEQVLRAMQRHSDRQKTLSAHGELVSDKRLQVEVANWLQLDSVEGRVLVHAEEENSGKRYLLLEATTGRVYFIPYTPEMEAARSRGRLKTNSFARLRKRFDDGRRRIEIDDYGPADDVLTNRRLLREKAQEVRQHGIEPSDDGWEGWLGRYQRAVSEIDGDRSLDRSKRRGQDRKERASSRGR